MPNRTPSPRCHQGLSQESSRTRASAAAVRSDTGCWKECEVTALHAHRTRQLHTPHKPESWSALFTFQKQKACGSAALNKRLEMQEHCRAACELESPVAADLLGDGDSVGSGSSADGFPAMVRHSRTRAAPRHPPVLLVENGRNQSSLVGGTAAQRSCSHGLLAALVFDKSRVFQNFCWTSTAYEAAELLQSCIRQGCLAFLLMGRGSFVASRSLTTTCWQPTIENSKMG